MTAGLSRASASATRQASKTAGEFIAEAVEVDLLLGHVTPPPPPSGDRLAGALICFYVTVNELTRVNSGRVDLKGLQEPLVQSASIVTRIGRYQLTKSPKTGV